MVETISVLNNSQGGKRISIIKTGYFQKDQSLKTRATKVNYGVYIWIHRNNIEFVTELSEEQKPYLISETNKGYYIQKKESWLKGGQYGNATKEGNSPVNTINSYTSGQQDEIVIVDVFECENPLSVEQRAWHQNPFFQSRKEKNGSGTEKIKAPISEMRSELLKIINPNNTEKFNERSISIDIRKDLVGKVFDSLKKGEKLTYALILHQRFCKTGFTLESAMDLWKLDKSLIFILFADDYTVYGSYKDWIGSKRCWGDKIRFVDAGSENIEEVIEYCRKNDILSFIKVGSKTTKTKFDYLKEIPSSKKVIIVEEADFGAWTTNNKQRSESLDGDILILESGTGIEKISFERKIDETVVLDSMDALMIKKGVHPLPDLNRYQTDYKNFPFPKFFDINFSPAIQKFQKELSGFDKTGLNKLFNNPNANRDYILSIFKVVLGVPDTNNSDSFSFNNLRRGSLQYLHDIWGNVSLVSFSHGLRKKDLKKIKEIILADKELSKRFEIIVLNGDYTTKEKSEEYTRGILESFRGSGKSILIFSSTMGIRSYSVPEIKNVFLMFDSGVEDTTSQIIFRGFTEGYQYDGKNKEYYNVICCSIDRNRESKTVLDLFYTDKIGNLSERYKISTEKATNLILSCYPLTIIDEEGITFESVDYKDFIKRNPKWEITHRMAYSSANINLISEIYRQTLENSGLKSEIIRDLFENKLDLKELKTKLKSKKTEEKNSQLNDKEKEEIEKALKILEALLAIIDRAPAIKYFLDKEGNFSIIDDLKEINSTGKKDEFYKVFKIELDICLDALENGAIKANLINDYVNEKILLFQLH